MGTWNDFSAVGFLRGTRSSACLLRHICFCIRIPCVEDPQSRTRRGWQPPLAPLLSMIPRNFNLNPAFNVGPR